MNTNTNETNVAGQESNVAASSGSKIWTLEGKQGTAIKGLAILGLGTAITLVGKGIGRMRGSYKLAKQTVAKAAAPDVVEAEVVEKNPTKEDTPATAAAAAAAGKTKTKEHA